MGLMEKVREGIAYGLVGLGTALPQSCVVVPYVIEAKANSPTAKKLYIEAIREGGKKEIESKIRLPGVKKAAIERLEKKIKEIEKKGGLEALVVEAPLPIFPSALNPENYKVALTYKGDKVAEYRIKKTENGYTADPSSVKVKKNSKLVRELKEEVGTGLCEYIAGTLTAAAVALYLKRKISKLFKKD